MLVMTNMKPSYFFAASASEEHWAYMAAQNSNLGICITNKLKKPKPTSKFVVSRFASSATTGNFGTRLWVVQFLGYF